MSPVSQRPAVLNKKIMRPGSQRQLSEKLDKKDPVGQILKFIDNLMGDTEPKWKQFIQHNRDVLNKIPLLPNKSEKMLTSMELYEYINANYLEVRQPLINVYGLKSSNRLLFVMFNKCLEFMSDCTIGFYDDMDKNLVTKFMQTLKQNTEMLAPIVKSIKDTNLELTNNEVEHTLAYVNEGVNLKLKERIDAENLDKTKSYYEYKIWKLQLDPVYFKNAATQLQNNQLQKNQLKKNLMQLDNHHFTVVDGQSQLLRKSARCKKHVDYTGMDSIEPESEDDGITDIWADHTMKDDPDYIYEEDKDDDEYEEEEDYCQRIIIDNIVFECSKHMNSTTPITLYRKLHPGVDLTKIRKFTTGNKATDNNILSQLRRHDITIDEVLEKYKTKTDDEKVSQYLLNSCVVSRCGNGVIVTPIERYLKYNRDVDLTKFIVVTTGSVFQDGKIMSDLIHGVRKFDEVLTKYGN